MVFVHIKCQPFRLDPTSRIKIANKISNLLQISNFEYLMHLNTLAGRSYNDITQVGHLDNFHVSGKIYTWH